MGQEAAPGLQVSLATPTRTLNLPYILAAAACARGQQHLLRGARVLQGAGRGPYVPRITTT